MSEVDQYHVYFSVNGFGDDPAVVTRIMGVEPTAAWAESDPLPRHPKARRLGSAWHLQSELPLNEPVNTHLENLLPRLERREQAVREVCRRYQAHVAVAAYFYGVNPAITLPPELIERIAGLQLGLEFDLYCLTDQP